MTKEQKEMMNDAPEREIIKPIITKKRVAIATGIVAAGIGAYYIGPKIVKKVQVAKAIKAGAKVI